MADLTELLSKAIRKWMEAEPGEAMQYAHGNAQGIARAAALVNGTSFHTQWVAGLDAYQRWIVEGK